MPPASLSTLAVMNPGPTTARKRASRLRQPRRNRARTTGAVLPPQPRDHVISGDNAGEPSVLVDDREGDEVVLVEEGGDLVFRRVRRARDVWLAERRQLRRRGRDRDLHKRHRARP